MSRHLPSAALTVSQMPSADADDIDIIRFAQTLNGYEAVGGEASALGAYVKTLEAQPLGALSLDDLRIMLFARQRAHYHQGGGWPGSDPLMDEMRQLTVVIRERVQVRGRGMAVWNGDITTLDVDAVVNAANRTLAGGGGVDGAVHRAAGPKLLEACLALPEITPGVRCPTGEARITPGFQLPARHVIHAVGPVWHGGNRGEQEALAAAYRASLALAAAHELESIALPAISTGAYGYPAHEAATVAVQTIRDFQAEYDELHRVVLVAFDARNERILRRALDAHAAA